MIRSIFASILIFILTNNIFAQVFVFNLPQMDSWYQLNEGDTLSYKFEIANADGTAFEYDLQHDEKLKVEFDTLGNFLWVPSYDLASRIEPVKSISMILQASNGETKVNKEIQFEITHTNRPPVINDLPVFYVKQYTNNEYYLNNAEQVFDPDEDPIVFSAEPEDLPQGASLSDMGVFSWRPSRNQFRRLQREPVKVKFTIQDQPEKMETQGELIVKATQMDLPPDILIVPSDSVMSVREDEVVNLNIYVSDPNGDENISNVGFVSNNLKVPKDALTKYTNTQWEFKWTPGYDFLLERGRVDSLAITFFAIDEVGKKSDKTVKIRVEDAENIEKRDLRLYLKYRNMLVEAMDLIAHLDVNQRELNQQLKKAKKGKRKRSIVNASLGAVTGVSPVFLDENSKDYVTGVGGTAVLTLGTLEATEVIGRSKDDITEKLKINIDIRNMLQAAGDNFARKYALKVKRRDPGFNTDIDKLKADLNNKRLILLELPADWENPKKPTDKNIRKTFPDFNNEGYADIDD